MFKLFIKESIENIVANYSGRVMSIMGIIIIILCCALLYCVYDNTPSEVITCEPVVIPLAETPKAIETLFERLEKAQ